MPFSVKWGDIDEDAKSEDLAYFEDPDVNNQTPTMGYKFLFPRQGTIESPIPEPVTTSASEAPIQQAQTPALESPLPALPVTLEYPSPEPSPTSTSEAPNQQAACSIAANTKKDAQAPWSVPLTRPVIADTALPMHWPS